KEHFQQARNIEIQAEDQKHIKGPKIGFYGVIDERFNLDLIRVMAEDKPEWQFILISTVVKINQETLPTNKNIYYKGQKTYNELPSYLAGWDVALIPFLLNESTRFISPTKTPEYLAAGIPVVSSAIRDVVKPYGVNQLVHIGNTPADFISAIESELQSIGKEEWLKKVDKFLQGNSWDNTCQDMVQLIVKTLNSKNNISIAS